MMRRDMKRPVGPHLALLLSSLLVIAGCGPYVVDWPDAGGGDDAPDAGSTDENPDAGRPPSEPPVGMPTPPHTVARPDATCSNGRRVIVKRAVDGDTVDLTITTNGRNERVRLIDVNTPESFPVEEKECFGDLASAHTHATLDGERVCLTYDPAVTAQSNNVDPFGRTLAYLWFGEDYRRFYNAELLHLGYARTMFVTRNTVYESYLRGLANEAKRDRRGLWGVCE